MIQGTLPKVRDISGDRLGGPARVSRSSGWSRMGRRSSRRSGTGRGTFPEVRDRSADHPGGP